MMASPFVFSFTPPPSPTPTLPGDVISYMIQVDGEIESLNHDMLTAITAGLQVPQGFRDQRNGFYQEWRTFSGTYMATGWVNTLPSTAWDQTAQYESKNEVWRDKFKALGGKPIGPGPQERPQSADVAGALKWSAAAVIAAVAGYGVYRFAGKRGN